MKKIDRVYVIGNGNQAPYGIGEIIDIIPVSHWHKVQEVCRRYYNPPTLRLNGKDGTDLDWDYDGLRVIGLVTCLPRT